MRSRLALMGAVLVVSIAVACSNDEPVEQASPLDPALTTIVSSEGTPPPVEVDVVAVSGVGPGLSVADAIASPLQGPSLVNGSISTESAGDVWLCDSLLHGDPTAADLSTPGSVWEEHAMCGEPRIEVSGLDPATVESFEFDGVLTVPGTMLAQ